MSRSVRKEPRYPVELPIMLGLGHAAAERLTRDVSFEGVFVWTDPAPDGAAPLPDLPLRQMVRITLFLPPHALRLEMTATVAHRRRRHRGQAGVGLRFFGMGRDERAAWEAFVSRLRDDFPPMTGRAWLPQGHVVDPIRRRASHALRIEVPTVGELWELSERGGRGDAMFCMSDAPLPEGTDVSLEIVHPDSGDVFELAGVVERCVDQYGLRGLSFALRGFDDERQARYREFVEDGLEVLFDDPELFDESASPAPADAAEPAPAEDADAPDTQAPTRRF